MDQSSATSTTMATTLVSTPPLPMLPDEVIISGGMGSGKDFVALNMVLPALRFDGESAIILCFADHFKIEVVAKDGVDFAKVWGSERDQATRQKLQLRGTEEGRSKHGEDIWLRTLDAVMQMHRMRGVKRFVICDCRFPNEAEFGRSLGALVIRLHAPKRTWARALKEAKGDETVAKQLLNHPSETSMNGRDDLWHVLIENDVGQEQSAAEAVAKVMAACGFIPHDSGSVNQERKRKRDQQQQQDQDAVVKAPCLDLHAVDDKPAVVAVAQE